MSKPFHATSLNLNETQLESLQRWTTAASYASSVAFREGDCSVLLASRRRAKPKEAFLRLAKSIFRSLDKDAAELRAQWRTLAAEATVNTAVAVGNRC